MLSGLWLTFIHLILQASGDTSSVDNSSTDDNDSVDGRIEGDFVDFSRPKKTFLERVQNKRLTPDVSVDDVE